MVSVTCTARWSEQSYQAWEDIGAGVDFLTFCKKLKKDGAEILSPPTRSPARRQRGTVPGTPRAGRLLGAREVALRHCLHEAKAREPAAAHGRRARGWVVTASLGEVVSRPYRSDRGAVLPGKPVGPRARPGNANRDAADGSRRRLRIQLTRVFRTRVPTALRLAALSRQA